MAMVKAADAHGSAARFKPLSIVVLAVDGSVRAVLSQAGATSIRFEIARGKASGALQMGVNSRDLEELATRRPAFFASLTQIAKGSMVAAAGGVLILGDDEQVLGAIGISGDSSENDEACAFVAIGAAGLWAKK